MNKYQKRIYTEKELDWYFNVFPTKLGLSAIDPAASILSADHRSYTDAQLSAVERSLPIHDALKKCSVKNQKVLKYGFTVQCWRTEIDHDGISRHYDLELVYGKLTGIVRAFRLRGKPADCRFKAETLFEKALNEFIGVFCVKSSR